MVHAPLLRDAIIGQRNNRIAGEQRSQCFLIARVASKSLDRYSPVSLAKPSSLQVFTAHPMANKKEAVGVVFFLHCKQPRVV